MQFSSTFYFRVTNGLCVSCHNVRGELTMTVQRNNIKALVITVALLLIFLGTTTVYATPITLPSGLSYFEQYRLVFVTSKEAMALSPFANDYDEFVNNVAQEINELAALGTSWTAIVSTGYCPDAQQNTATSPFVQGLGVPIFNLGGELVAPNYPHFWSNNLIHPIDIFEDGTACDPIQIYPHSSLVWTGMSNDGTTTDRPLGMISGAYVGDCRSTGTWMRDGDEWPPYTLHRFYAISGLLRNEQFMVPVPSTLILFSSGIFGLLGLRRKNRKVSFTGIGGG